MKIHLEIERLVNLTRGFGWEKVREEKTEDKLTVTLEKKIEPDTTGIPA
ncbi:MAG: hypothetical protein IMF10_04320 [Proteobacteria bacterium]|nr:hypothetical protein [Pseudomonadota bacterium]